MTVEVRINTPSMASPSTHRSPVNSAYGQRNAQLLARYASDRSLANRNAVVQANLPLVWQAARLESRRSGHDFEDLSQVGCLGLIKAVEHYESGRGASLSSAAMPWIVGAIRQHLRDRGQALRGGRTLRELHQRGQQLQARRQQQQLPPLPAAELAAALGCSPQRWQEALGLQQALSMASLQQPLGAAAGEGGCLQDQLLDPASASDRYGAVIRSERRQLLWRQLRRLQRDQRRLLLARVLRQQAWGTIGASLGLSGRVAQRRFEALVAQLRGELEPLLAGA